ncbi:MAG: hypothetical protein ABIG96_04655 [Candidatus Micrarchaeota archaeon]
MDDRAQTAIEYLLMVSAVIFFVIIVFMLVNSNVFSEARQRIFNTSDDIFNKLRG